MAGFKPQHQLWDLSRGIVFAKSGKVVYPRLPPVAGYHSSPDLLSQQDDQTLIADAGFGSPASRQAAAASERPVEPVLKGRAKSAPAVEPETPETSVPEPAAEVTATPRDTLLEQDASDAPPFTPLKFRIPDGIFQEAKHAKPGEPESFWSYALYRGGLEDDGLSSSKVKVHYCKSIATTERVLQNYFMNEELLGFDLEWSPRATATQGTKRNVSLIQIASKDRIALFHVALFPKSDEDVGYVPPTFKKIMEDPEITKAGVSIKSDCTRLRTYMGIQSRGIFELSHLYKLVKYSKTRAFGDINRKTVGLATQVQDCLGLPMFKGSDVRASDWSQPLVMRQIEYSASDAYAAVQIYAVLDHQRQQLDPMPPLPYHAELNRPIRLADGAVLPSEDDNQEPAGHGTEADAGVAVSPGERESLGARIRIETDDEPILKNVPEPPGPARQPPPKDERIVAAEKWLTERHASAASAPKAAGASLRAYHIWHHNRDLDPRAIARLLRDPPLQASTVVNYILEAIRLEKLPYDAVRLQDEVLSLLPPQVLASRYKGLISQCKQAVASAATAEA